MRRTIGNGSKRTISTSNRLGLLQMILESDTELYASEDVGPLKEWIMRFHIGWSRAKHSLETRVWKPLPSLLILKIVRLMTIYTGLKRTKSTSDELGLLHQQLLNFILNSHLFV